MISLLRYVLVITIFCWAGTVCALEKTLNIFTWAGEIPYPLIERFEKETGIKVNSLTFDTNETLFTKVRASPPGTFDLIEPSSFYIDRMRRLGQLERLDKTKLPNLKNLDPLFLNPSYDPKTEYSIPFIWGVTGLFVNKNYFNPKELSHWSQLTHPKYKNQLMFLDDSREVFSMALRLCGYSINDSNPVHIHKAYLKLKELMPNVRLFNSDAVSSMLIDEDATIGMAWNGDLYRSFKENPQLDFVFPAEGFEIWVDNFALLKNALHKENAYLFLNFLMRPENAKEVSLTINYSTTNLTARQSMPAEIRNHPTLYPSAEILKQGEFQADMSDKTLTLYESYWERLKMNA